MFLQVTFSKKLILDKFNYMYQVPFDWFIYEAIRAEMILIHVETKTDFCK